jgi:hypothetical protein
MAHDKEFARYHRFGVQLVRGWLKPQVLSILRIVDSTQRSEGVKGGVAEIGVHQGRLFIALKLLCDNEFRSVAIDLFDRQELNIGNSGKGDLKVFKRNVQRWSSANNLAVHIGDSCDLDEGKLREITGSDIRLFSVDGGHSEETVMNDMRLAEKVTVDGGVVIADDVFNEEWPSVSVATYKYLADGGALQPFAIGFNKVFFTTSDAFASKYMEALRGTLGRRDRFYFKTAQFADHDVVIVVPGASTLRALVKQSTLATRLYRRLK